MQGREVLSFLTVGAGRRPTLRLPPDRRHDMTMTRRNGNSARDCAAVAVGRTTATAKTGCPSQRHRSPQQQRQHRRTVAPPIWDRTMLCVDRGEYRPRLQDFGSDPHGTQVLPSIASQRKQAGDITCSDRVAPANPESCRHHDAILGRPPRCVTIPPTPARLCRPARADRSSTLWRVELRRIDLSARGDSAHHPRPFPDMEAAQ